MANAIKEGLAGEVVVANFATTTEHGAIEGRSQAHIYRDACAVIILTTSRSAGSQWTP